MAHFSLAWEAHKQNICQGLSVLQQNGEFVDMTIAADGHHVKVHQMIMSLASPYIKDLILTAQCPHPVIFLNKVSYTVLCSILEYIYTGEAVVDMDHLTELVEAGKELHIKGLEDMKMELAAHTVGQRPSEKVLVEVPSMSERSKQLKRTNISRNQDPLPGTVIFEHEGDDDTFDDQMDTSENCHQKTSVRSPGGKNVESNGTAVDTSIQYTISNQGALQMILNRNMYYLRYTSRKGDGGRSWKCINYQKKKTGCPASVITKDDIVIKRFGAHNHPFHDREILRKVRDGAVYGRIQEAEECGRHKKAQNDALPNITVKRKSEDVHTTDVD